MIAWFTLGMQFVVLIAVAASTVYTHRARQHLQKLIEATHAYRHEVEWLTARVETLEQRRNGAR